ncbi:hypothetical protein DFH06DRAFT_1349113 [Mycena polygramma]|nr:hypothetical protein DFH06DRAFT_1349113 [Mycena polygramma]
MTILTTPQNPTTFAKLTYLELRNQPPLSWSTVMRLAPNVEVMEWFQNNLPRFPARYHMPHLTRLVLWDANAPVYAPNLSHLTVLDSSFTDLDLVGLTDTRSSRVTRIRSLEFISNRNMSDHQLALVIQSCSNVHRITINNQYQDRFETFRELGRRVSKGYICNDQNRLAELVVTNIPCKEGPAKNAFEYLVRLGELNNCLITFHRTIFRVRVWGCKGSFNDTNPSMLEQIRRANGFGWPLVHVVVDEELNSYERAFNPFSITLVFIDYYIAMQCAAKGAMSNS